MHYDLTLGPRDGQRPSAISDLVGSHKDADHPALMPEAVNAAAWEAWDAGLSILPIQNDWERPRNPDRGLADKLPDLDTWKYLQSTQASEDEVRQWFGPRGAERDQCWRTGLGVITGKVSAPEGQALILFDFDDATAYEQFKVKGEELGIGSQIAAIEAGFLERTPKGGAHWLFNYEIATGEAPAKPQKLALRPGESADPSKLKTLIETKGEGGYAVVAPTHGRVHKTGLPYELVSGGFGSISSITAREFGYLIALARSFDEMPQKAPVEHREPSRPRAEGDGLSPGDDYASRHSWADILEPQGWKLLFMRGDCGYWRRPGKDEGWSATTNHTGGNNLHVFSSSTCFPPGESISKFAAFAHMKHSGDMSAAARELASMGYGKQTPAPKRTTRALKSSVGVNGVNGHHGTNGKVEPTIGAAVVVATGAGIPVELETEGATRPNGFNRTDLGNAERLAYRHGKTLRYVHPWRSWLIWDGKRWSQDKRGSVYAKAKDTVRGIYKEAHLAKDSGDREALAEWAMESEGRSRIESMISLASREEPIPVLPEELDQDPWLFNVSNGTIDLRTGELRPHSQGDYITKLCRVTYDPDAKCPVWQSTLELFLVDPNLIGYLQRIIGYCLTGVVQDHILPVAYGDGSNGKSTIFGRLLNVFGSDYAMKAGPELLMVKRGEAHSTERMDLFGKRLVLAIETEEGRRLNEAMVKELTGGDRIRGRRMREDSWEFDATHKVMLATNHKPAIQGTDHGIWRRVKLMPFTQKMDEERADKKIEAKLKAEHAGILAWAVRGCLDWQREGLATPPQVAEATQEYREEEDVLGGFLQEHCIVNPSVRSKAGELYSRYKAWAEVSGFNVMSVQTFGKRMGDRGFRILKASGNFRLGIGLRHPTATSDGPDY